MDNCRALLFNQAVNAQLAVTPAPVGSVNSLINDSPSEALQINSTSATLTLNWSEPVMLGGICLWQTNLTTGAQVVVKLKLSGSIVATINLESSLSVLPLMPRNYWFNFFENQLLNEIVIEIADVSNPFNYLQLSYLYIGYAFSPFYNFDYGYKVVWQDDSKQERTFGGSVFTDNIPNYRSANISLSHVDNAERDTFSQYLMYASTKHLVFISLFPTVTDRRRVEYAFLGKFKTPPADYTATRYNNQTITWDIVESIGGNGTPMGVTFTGGCDPALIAGFLTQIQALQQQIEQLQANNATLQVQINQSQVIVDTLPQQVATLQTNLADCAEEKDSLDDDLVVCQQEKTVLATEKANLIQENTDLTTQNTQLQTNLTTCQTEKTTIQTNLTACSQEKQVIIQQFVTFKETFLGTEAGVVEFFVQNIDLNIEFIPYTMTGLVINSVIGI